MATRDLWHLGFARLIRQRAPPGFLVRAEVPLSDEPQRADLILIRREDVPRRDDQAELLRALWPTLSSDTVLELKSPVRGFRRNDLKRLASYGARYHVLEDERLLRPGDLTLVLVIPSRNAALDVAVLLLRADLGRARLHPEVSHHREVVVVEQPFTTPLGQHELAIRNAVCGRRRIVRLVVSRHPAELKQRRLHASANRGHRLRQAHRCPLPVREGQYEHAQHV